MTQERSALPAEIVRVIEQVLEAAGLDFVDGRAEVEQELVAHFEDGLAAGRTIRELVDTFGDPLVAGRKIARTRPRAAARSRGETGRWWMSFQEWVHETKRAARRLGRAPGFTAVVILTLALGVGANTAIFTVLNAVLLQDLPYPEADRLVRIFEANEEDPEGGEYLRAPHIGIYRDWDEIFEDVASLYTYREMGADLTGGEVAERVNVLWVSAGYFETLGISVDRGRTFRDEESYGAGEASTRTIPIEYVAVISHGLWGRRYGGAGDVVGRTIELDGTRFEIVGVMPRGFRNPFGGDTDVWLPHDLRMGGSNHFNNWFLSSVARLRPGIDLEQAQDRARVLAQAFDEEEPNNYGAYPRLIPLQESVVGSTRSSMLWILAAAAVLVLLTACVNVANLLFARGLGQDRSLALRAALGSGRGRLVASILLENGLLAAGGGLAGLALGWIGIQGLLALAPGVVPGVTEIKVGAGVFLFASAVTVGALVVFGLTPALRMSRTAPAEVLRSGDRASTVGRAVRRLRDGLVIVQVATALSLVAGAALFTRSFQELVDVPLGIEPEGVLTYEVHLPEARYPEGGDRHRFHEELHARVAALPDVERVGATSWMPVNGRYHSWGAHWDPIAPDETSHNEHWWGTDVRMIAGDYFGSMGIDVVAGLGPEEVDLESGPMMWMNRELADAIFEDADPVGQRVFIADALREVVGVVESIPHDTRGTLAPISYIPHLQYADDRNWALIQTALVRGDEWDAASRIEAEIRAIDNQLVMYRTSSLEQHVAVGREQDRFATVLMAAFAALALVLSLVGTYGVLSGTVAGRTHEIGIRMALGADTSRVRSMILRYAAALTLPGIALGLVGAWFASRWIEALLFEVGTSDPFAYSGAVLVFLGVGLLSGWIPAQRATRVDTVTTLTAE